MPLNERKGFMTRTNNNESRTHLVDRDLAPLVAKLLELRRLAPIDGGSPQPSPARDPDQSDGVTITTALAQAWMVLTESSTTARAHPSRGDGVEPKPARSHRASEERGAASDLTQRIADGVMDARINPAGKRPANTLRKPIAGEAAPNTGGHDPLKKGARVDDPSWLKTAFGESDVREVAGEKANPRILEYFDKTWQKGQRTDDTGKENAWCAAFVTFALTENRIKNGKAVGARSYETWGEPSEAFRGAIVVLEKNGQKHVAMLVGVDKDGNNLYLGGNQSNAVKISHLPDYQVIAVRKPSNYEVPAHLKTLPTLPYRHDKQVSTR